MTLTQKRLAVLATSSLLLIALGFSSIYFFTPWLQHTHPRQPLATQSEIPSAIPIQAAMRLFGGNINPAVASNIQLKGVLVAQSASESSALLALEGQPIKTIYVGQAVAPGITLQEVQKHAVLLSEGGVTKRVIFPKSLPDSSGTSL